MIVIQPKPRRAGTAQSKGLGIALKPIPVADDVPAWQTVGCTVVAYLNVEDPAPTDMFDITIEGWNGVQWGSLAAATGVPAVHPESRMGPSYRPQLKYRSTKVDAKKLRVVVTSHQDGRWAAGVEVE